MIAMNVEGQVLQGFLWDITASQAQTMELICSNSSLADHSLQDLAGAFRASHRLRQLTLCDVPPDMLCMASGIFRLEELSLVDICGKDTDLGNPLKVIIPCLCSCSNAIIII